MNNPHFLTFEQWLKSNVLTLEKIANGCPACDGDLAMECDCEGPINCIVRKMYRKQRLVDEAKWGQL